jgi:hypothetical protein
VFVGKLENRKRRATDSSQSDLFVPNLFQSDIENKQSSEKQLYALESGSRVRSIFHRLVASRSAKRSINYMVVQILHFCTFLF